MGDPIGLILLIPPLLFALTVHEFSHGWAALKRGDPTARLEGRLTLNPIPHLDLLGSMVFLISQTIGWAKPVPVDPRYLMNPRRDMMWIALAGPISNIILALLFGTILRVVVAIPHEVTGVAELVLVKMVVASVQINLALAAFNMIPIFPLDGSKVLTGLLSPQAAARFQSFEAVGPYVLLGLILLGSVSGVSVIGVLVSPFVRTVGGLFTGGIL